MVIILLMVRDGKDSTFKMLSIISQGGVECLSEVLKMNRVAQKKCKKKDKQGAST